MIQEHICQTVSLSAHIKNPFLNFLSTNLIYLIPHFPKNCFQAIMQPIHNFMSLSVLLANTPLFCTSMLTHKTVTSSLAFNIQCRGSSNSKPLVRFYDVHDLIESKTLIRSGEAKLLYQIQLSRKQRDKKLRAFHEL